MQDFDWIKIMNSQFCDHTLQFWVRKLDNGELEFEVTKLENPQRLYGKNGELKLDFPNQTLVEARNFQEILKTTDDWHFGEPDFKIISKEYVDDVWQEFQNRKSIASDSDKSKIEEVESSWAESCGKTTLEN